MAVQGWLPRVLALVAVAGSLTCGGDTGDGDGERGTTIIGTVYWSGPVGGATVVAFQLVNDRRSLEVGRATTAADGSFSIDMGNTFEHVELDVIGGSYHETAYAEGAGGDVALDGNTTLHGIVLDLQLGEQRSGVVVSPWSHLVVSLGRARFAAAREPTYGAAMARALARVTNHLTFDPLRTAVAPASAEAGSPTDQVKHGLSLAGLSQLAAVIAADQGVTVQSVNTVELTKVLARDAGSAEALLDGNGTEILFVGASCPLPTGCGAEGLGCYASCHVYTNSLRSRLGSAVLVFLLSEANGTTLTRDDVSAWLEGIRINPDGELFGSDDAEEFDSVGPSITWVLPAANATVAGSVAVEVTASDPVGVESLTVTVESGSPFEITDGNPNPERFEGTLATAGLPEGLLTLTAVAFDVEGNMTGSPRQIVINNVSGGTVSGVVYKGRVGGATVRVYRFENGVRGLQAGEGTTQQDGSFTNIMVADGYSGPLLIEAGFGGTYPEEAATATVTLDVADRLRTVVPVYADGDAIANLAVTPLTTFATTYAGWLTDNDQGGATLPARWQTARVAMETQFGVANVYDLTPLAPGQMTTFNAPARYGMILVGLSELARDASTLGGGDGGTFGPAMNAMRVVRVLETDLADGCWDGRGPGGAQLYFGGTEAVTTRSTRMDLANAIVAYLDDGARNQTPYAGAADVLTQLDVLAAGGGNAAPGACSVTSGINPDAGETSFDQTPPTVKFLDAMSLPPGVTPPAGHVRGVITVEAVATDNLDTRPSLRFIAPAMTADADGDESDSDARHVFDTTQRPDGPLTVTLEARDDAGKISDPAMSTRVFVVDNTPPTITFNVMNESWHPAPGPFVTYTVNEMNVASTTATLDGAPFQNGAQVSAMGQHTLLVTVQDQAGAVVSGSLTFYVDGTAPTLALGTVTPSGSVVKDTLSVTVTADDILKNLGSLGSAITVTATGPNGPVTPTSVTPSVLGDMKRQLVVTFDTNQIPDGQLTMRFDVTDRAGNAATQLAVNRTVDNTDPVPVTNVTDGTWYASALTVTCGQTDTNQGTTMATLNASPFTCGSPVTVEGRHVLVVTATDAAGNTATRTVTFYVDLTNPVLTVLPPNPDGAWVSGLLDVTAEATDSLQGLGSLPNDITAMVTSSPGTTSPGTSWPTVAGGARRIRNMINTATVAGAADASGSLSIRYDVTDAAGRMAAPRTVTVMVDNNPPEVTINDVGSAPIATYTNDPTPTITGTVEAGGAPVTISLRVGAQAMVMVAPSGGTWSYTVPASLALVDGTYSITATATDAAGNSYVATPTTMIVDTVGPTTTFRPSAMVDEKTCTVAYPTLNMASGVFTGVPAAYGACDPTTAPAPPMVSLNTGTAVVGKYVTRLSSVITSDNPIKWNLSTGESGGVGVAAAADTLQFKVYRLGQPEPGSWVNATGALLNGGDVDASALVLATDWPELLTHSSADMTGAFVIKVRGRDRLGNVGPEVSNTWLHRPLAPPVPLFYQALAPQSSTDPLWPYSIFRNSLTPSTDQAEPGEAMSTSILTAFAPRGLFEFKVWNPHDQPVTVGFFIPGVSGASHARRIWDTSPWIDNASLTTPTNGTCPNNPPNTPWPNIGWSARINHSAPFNCNTGSCTCNGAGWDEPASSEPGVPTTTAIGSGAGQHPFQVYAYDAQGSVFLNRLSIDTSITSGGTHSYFEFTVPPRFSPNQARHVRVLVALPNLDLFSPTTNVQTNPPQVSDGPGSEVIRRGGIAIPTTAAWYERWGDCSFWSGLTCNAVRPRHRYRVLTEARMSLGQDELRVNVRTRASAAATSLRELVAGEGDNVVDQTNGSALSWHTCEGNLVNGTCTPFVATTSMSD